MFPIILIPSTLFFIFNTIREGKAIIICLHIVRYLCLHPFDIFPKFQIVLCSIAFFNILLQTNIGFVSDKTTPLCYLIFDVQRYERFLNYQTFLQIILILFCSRTYKADTDFGIHPFYPFICVLTNFCIKVGQTINYYQQSPTNSLYSIISANK